MRGFCVNQKKLPPAASQLGSQTSLCPHSLVMSWVSPVWARSQPHSAYLVLCFLFFTWHFCTLHKLNHLLYRFESKAHFRSYTLFSNLLPTNGKAKISTQVFLIINTSFFFVLCMLIELQMILESYIWCLGLLIHFVGGTENFLGLKKVELQSYKLICLIINSF